VVTVTDFERKEGRKEGKKERKEFYLQFHHFYGFLILP
jgi:hypothetical protein